MTCWTLLFLAAACEIAFATGMKFTDGFSRPLPSLFTLTAMTASIALLSRAVRGIPLGTAYAMWTGIGIVGTAVAGALWFGESLTPARGGCILLILAGVAGLKLL